MTETRPGHPGTDPGADPGTPADPDQLREQIEQTRAELGDTVEALAAKADVKARAGEKASELSAKARQSATEGAHTVQRTAVELKDKLGAKTTELSGKAREITPERARQAGDAAIRTARDKRGPLAALVAGLVLMGVLIRRRRRR